MVRVLPFIAAIGLAPSIGAPSDETHFTQAEVEAVRALWSETGRYRAERPGQWQARQTTEGSEWLLAYYKAKSGTNAKVKPGVEPEPPDPRFAKWDIWVEAKYTFDEWSATARANDRNGSGLTTTPPVHPGAVDPALVALLGEPPTFVAPVQPIKHWARFEDGTTLAYEDHVAVRRKYAYYRFNEGVISMGRRVRELPKEELDSIMEAADITDSEQRIFFAVSALEGGFDSVNTYDTGLVSVGVIQFACLREGGGSLGGVMLRTKRNDPEEFELYFRQYGLDVSADGKLVALDIYTGDELIGPAAAQQIIRDQRLIACFQHAGLKSRAFQVAQLQVAKERYYPADDVIKIVVNGRPMQARVGDIFRTEAGMATLMDRKVNTGKLDPLAEVLTELCLQMGYADLREAAAAEYLLTRMVTYRRDFLADSVALTKPRDTGITLSRGGDRIPPTSFRN